VAAERAVFLPMGHDHEHHAVQYNRAFAIGIILNVAFVVVEAVFGVISDSVALLADAGHNLSDVLGLLLAWGSNLLSLRTPTHRRTYGWKSSTLLAALVNAVILLVSVGGIAWESIRRFAHPQVVEGHVVIVVACIGVVINTLTALLFMAGRERDLNIRGAFLHMAADAGVSLGVVIAGIGISTLGWLWIDPVVGLSVAAIVLIGTWRLFRESFDLVLHAVPRKIDVEAITAYLSGLPGVESVHDVHVWAMSTTEVAMTAHLVKPGQENDDEMLARIHAELHDRFGIEHATVQVERDDIHVECGLECYPPKNFVRPNHS